ncbi:MAG TPA: hypothetical protein VD838_21165 [Anaeromyxobacteraceae bacterium]|nr:hypothetical protein [Anaeromyxobacteraceae bacterium]
MSWKTIAALVVAGALLGALLVWLLRPEPKTITIREGSAAAFDSAAARIAELEARARDVDLLARARNRLAGVSVLEPAEPRIVYDTIIRVDTVRVVLWAELDPFSGELELTRAEPSDSGGHTPIGESFDASRCSGRLTITGAGVVCDEQRLGHAWISIGPALLLAYEDDALERRLEIPLELTWDPGRARGWTAAATLHPLDRRALFHVKRAFDLF